MAQPIYLTHEDHDGCWVVYAPRFADWQCRDFGWQIADKAGCQPAPGEQGQPTPDQPAEGEQGQSTPWHEFSIAELNCTQSAYDLAFANELDIRLVTGTGVGGRRLVADVTLYLAL